MAVPPFGRWVRLTLLPSQMPSRIIGSDGPGSDPVLEQEIRTPGKADRQRRTNEKAPAFGGALEKSGKNFGRDDPTRTDDPHVPNVVR